MLCSTLSGSRVLPRSITILVSTNRYVSYDVRSNPITIATKFLSLESTPIVISFSQIVCNFVR